MLRHQASHCTRKEIEILSHSLYEPNAMRLEINHQETMAANTNARKLDNMLLNKQGSAGETKEEI